MRRTSKKPISADTIADMADRGENISKHFSNRFTAVRPSAVTVQRVNVDFSAPMLQELDHEATSLNISRQAVIKMMLRDALDRRHLALQARKAAEH